MAGHLPVDGAVTCEGIDRALFLSQGFVILRGVVPPELLQPVRSAYEVLVGRPRDLWRRQGSDTWDTSAQPRLNLKPYEELGGVGLPIDESAAAAVELWCHPNLQRASSQLLGIPDAGVTEMMLMCNPVAFEGPSSFHRDFSAPHSAPIEAYIDLNKEGSTRYLQWNLCLHDDKVLGLVPRSHLLMNTSDQNARMSADQSGHMPGAVQTQLRAGDAAVYMMPILHAGLHYSPVRRRTVHGGEHCATSHASGAAALAARV